MPRRNWRLRIEDIVAAVQEAQRFTDGMSFAEFANDTKTIRAVDYELVVIGEAARHVPLEVESRHPDVPWSKLRSMRNIITHEYFGVDPWILWQTVQQDLPPLLPRLQAILDETP